MLRTRKRLAIFLLTLLLAQPVYAETVPTTEPEPDIVTAVYTVQTLPSAESPRWLQTEQQQWLYRQIAAPLYDESFTPVLAAQSPEDVTGDFAGTWGIPANAQRGYVFRISLNGAACREDGTVITAGQCIRAVRDAFENTDDWLFLANAKAIRAQECKPGGEIIRLTDGQFSDVSQAWAAGYRDFYVDLDGFWGLDAGWRPVSDRTRFRDYAMPGGLDEGFVSAAYLYNNYLMDGMESSVYQREFVGICSEPGEAYTMDDLGLVEESDSAFLVILQSPSTASTVMTRLQKLVLPGASYGPYRIVSASAGNLLLEPNPNWWGAEDQRGYDRILCQKIGS